MQILGELIQLPGDNSEYYDMLPLPWFHRAVLSLSHGTAVYVAGLKPVGRPVGDVIVSVLDPFRLHRIRRVSVLVDERPGIVNEVAHLVASEKRWNIDLSETVTINSGGKHYIDLFIEPYSNSQGEDDAKLVGDLRHKLKLNFKDAAEVATNSIVGPTHFVPFQMEDLEGQIAWMNPDASVQDGWIRERSWRRRICELPAASLVDLSQVVISAETTRRILRYTFPRKGALTFVVRGVDGPGAMDCITFEINKARLSILSSLIKRGGQGRGRSTFIAVCEPVTDLIGLRQSSTEESKRAAAEVKEGLEGNKYEPEYHFEVKTNPPQEALKRTYVRPRNHQFVRPKDNMAPDIRIEKQKHLEAGKIPVFIAQRFHRKNSLADRIIELMKASLVKCGCAPLVATPVQDGGEFAWNQVYTKMWAAAGCVTVVFYDAFEWEQKGRPTFSLAQEYGFMIGMGKPTTILVPDEGYKEVVENWFDIQGKVLPTYPVREAASEELWAKIDAEAASGRKEPSAVLKAAIAREKFSEAFSQIIDGQIETWCNSILMKHVRDAH